jgi:membrane peptidoglycan carboxypeptidase
MKKILNKFLIKPASLLLIALFAGFFGVFFVIGIAGASYTVMINRSLPSFTELQNRDIPESSKLYARDGTLIYEFYGEYKRSRISLDQIPPNLKNATLAIEDKDYYKHGAVSLQSIVRALTVNYKTGTSSQGGSTITQQFVKNALLNREKKYSRKVREVLLAYKVEAHFTKDEILEAYFNEIPYGRNSYGVEAASKAYFNKSASQLNLAESAYLAALPQAPSYYSPSGNNRASLDERKDLVLQKMFEQGYITEIQMNEARATVVAFVENKGQIKAPYFVAWVQNYLSDKYGEEFLKEGGLKVYSSLDMNMQTLAEQVVKEGAQTNKVKNRAYNAALVAVDPTTNKVMAMVGGKDFFGSPEPAGCKVGANCKFEPNVNVSTSERQPGSSFKPYVYLTAFKPEFGYTPLSKVLDKPTAFGTNNGRPYIPRNYNGSSHGLITIRKALAGSLNVPAVRTLVAVGEENAITTAKSLGITSPLKGCGLSLVLGGCEVRLVDHTTAFSVIANGGKGYLSSPFMRIEDKHGKILEDGMAKSEQVVNSEAVYELISIMIDDPSRHYVFGKKNPLTLPDGRQVAAKTGTTQNWRDGWTMMCVPQLCTGVWTGNNDGSLMRAGADGVFTAAPIAQKFMIESLKNVPPKDFEVPAGVVQVAYDMYTNKPVAKDSKNVRMEPVPWYAIPKDIQISAAPKNLKRSLIGPIDAKSTPVNGQGTVSGAQTNVPSTESSLPPTSYTPVPEVNVISTRPGSAF